MVMPGAISPARTVVIDAQVPVKHGQVGQDLFLQWINEFFIIVI